MDDRSVSVELGLLDGGVGVLEVEAGGQLALRLVDGVAHLLAVDLGHDVEGRHGRRRYLAPLTLSSTLQGRCPSGQREQTVNLPAQPTVVRIHPGPHGRKPCSEGCPTVGFAGPDRSVASPSIPRASRGMGVPCGAWPTSAGGVASDGSPRYECCWRDPATHRERSKTFRRKADAERHATLVEADTIRGVTVPTPADGNRRVGDVVSRWLELHSPTLKVKTASTYAGLARSRILPPLGEVRLAQLRRSDVQAWINAMVGEGLSVSRIRQAHVVLAEALDWAVRDACSPSTRPAASSCPASRRGSVPGSSPSPSTPSPRRLPTTPRSGRPADGLPRSAVRRAGRAPAPQRRPDAPAALGHRHHGRGRRAATCADTPKSHQARVMPLVDHLVEPLTAHLDTLPADPDGFVLIRSARGGPLRYTHWRRSVWTPACAATGVVGVTPHALRHSTGKMLANSGVPDGRDQAHHGPRVGLVHDGRVRPRVGGRPRRRCRRDGDYRQVSIGRSAIRKMDHRITGGTCEPGGFGDPSHVPASRRATGPMTYMMSALYGTGAAIAGRR